MKYIFFLFLSRSWTWGMESSVPDPFPKFGTRTPKSSPHSPLPLPPWHPLQTSQQGRETNLKVRKVQWKNTRRTARLCSHHVQPTKFNKTKSPKPPLISCSRVHHAPDSGGPQWPVWSNCWDMLAGFRARTVVSAALDPSTSFSPDCFSGSLPSRSVWRPQLKLTLCGWIYCHCQMRIHLLITMTTTIIITTIIMLWLMMVFANALM